mgnify:CR=1 FL=1
MIIPSLQNKEEILKRWLLCTTKVRLVRHPSNGVLTELKLITLKADEGNLLPDGLSKSKWTKEH